MKPARWLTYEILIKSAATFLEDGEAAYCFDDFFVLPGDISHIYAFHATTSVPGGSAVTDYKNFAHPIGRIHLEFNAGADPYNEIIRPDWNRYDPVTGLWTYGRRVCERPVSVEICDPRFRMFVDNLIPWTVLEDAPDLRALVFLLVK